MRAAGSPVPGARGSDGAMTVRKMPEWEQKIRDREETLNSLLAPNYLLRKFKMYNYDTQNDYWIARASDGAMAAGPALTLDDIQRWISGHNLR